MTSLFSKAKEFREWAAPTLKSSAFLTRGVLTPEEFVKAGDELVFKCPTWSWEGGDPTRARPYLPRDKQVGLACRSSTQIYDFKLQGNGVHLNTCQSMNLSCFSKIQH